jgi:hypothetical protein
LVRVLAWTETRRGVGERGRKSRPVGLLRQIARHGARLQKAGAGIRLDETRGNPQQRGFARSVTPHQANAFPRSNAEIGTVQ